MVLIHVLAAAAVAEATDNTSARRYIRSNLAADGFYFSSKQTTTSHIYSV